MQKPRRTRTLLVLAATVAVAALAVPAAALADGPVIWFNNDTTPQTIEEWGDCPTFTIDATFQAQRRNEDFYDAAGNLILERRHVDFTGTLYNASTPARAVPYEGHFTLTIDFTTNTLTFTGLLTHAIVPGSGVINLTAGITHITPTDVIEHGPSGDLTQLCAALN
jgi:hypothetical protein